MGAHVFHTVARNLRRAQIAFHVAVELHSCALGFDGFDRAFNDTAFFVTRDKAVDRVAFHLLDAVRNFRKGQDVEALVLGIDLERERISLGIKQMEGDPINSFVSGHEKGSIVKGTIKTIEAKGATVQLDSDMEGYLRASEISRDRVEDMRTHYKEGDEIEAMVINVDRKNRVINLSIKAKDMTEQDSAMKKMASESSAAASGSTNLGALLKAKLENKNAEQ